MAKHSAMFSILVSFALALVSSFRAFAQIQSEGSLAFQVGSYNDLTQANERAVSLKSAGGEARIVQAQIQNRGTWYRVQVGRFTSHIEEDRYGKQLQAKGAVKDFIVTEYDVGIAQSQPSQIVLASFQSPDGEQFVLVPFLLYSSNQYVPLPQEVDATPEDEDNAKTFAAKEASIFNQVRIFDVYRKGKKIGSFLVTGIKATYIGAITKIVGIGQANGFQPGYGDIAISGAHLQEGFWPASPLNATQRKQLRSLALGLLPKVIPRNNVWPEISGKRIILGSLREQTAVLDLDRDGNPEIALQINADVKSPEGGLNAYIFVLARYNRTAQEMSKLLGSAVITQGELIYGEAIYGLLGAVDIDGDGVAEIILEKGYGRAGSLEIFSLRGGQLHKVCVIVNWSGS